ncbi:MAG: LapA family protein [Limnobacter sp.]|nr:LapA family protein [Limnobacter sp.]
MKVFNWIVRIALFLVVLTFSIRNTDIVAVRWLPGLEVQLPLILALLSAFILGVVFAWLILVPSWLKAKRSSSVASKKLAKVENMQSKSQADASAPSEPIALPLGPGHGI